MSQYVDTYQLGVTLIPVGTGAGIQVLAGRGINGWTFKKMSGGTLAIINATGMTSTQGYIMGDTETLSVKGPATFFLAAGGATVVVGLVASLSSGYSLIR